MPLAAAAANAASGGRATAGFVFEQRHDGIRPIRDVVLGLLITDRPEAGYQDVQLLPAECASRADAGGGLHPAGVSFALSSCGETRDRLVIPGDLSELVQEFVHPLLPFGRERVDRLR